MDKVSWGLLSKNPSAIELLKAHKNKINWALLSSNPSAFELLSENLDKINYKYLLTNPHPTILDELTALANEVGINLKTQENPFKSEYERLYS
jgi:hypothetical protein